MKLSKRLQTLTGFENFVEPRYFAQCIFSDNVQRCVSLWGHPLLKSLHSPIGSTRRQQTIAGRKPVHQQERRTKDTKGDQSGQHSYTLFGSKMSAESRMPLASSRSANFGRTPVALNRPLTF